MTNKEYIRIASKLYIQESRIMPRIITYSLSTFGRYETIEPSPEIMVQIMAKLGDFLPNTTNAIRIDSTGNLEAKQCINMFNKQSGFVVSVLPDRLDVTYQYTDVVLNQEADVLKENSGNYMEKMLEVLDLRAWRLAVNARISLAQINREQMLSLAEKFTPFARGDEIVEWNTYYNDRGRVTIKDATEQTNRIVNLLCTQISNNAYDISTLFDINTHQGNTLDRFTKESIKVFSCYAENFMQQKVEDLMERLK